MGLLRNLFRRRRLPMVDVQIGVPPGISTKNAKDPKLIQKSVVVKYASWPHMRSGFQAPEYDLAEILRAADTESYLRLSFEKHEELILKNRWRFVSQNTSVLGHVLKRLTEISWSQDTPLDVIIERGVEDLVETSNTFYVLARREQGERYKSRFNRNLYPISGIFSPNPSTMQPDITTGTKSQKITKWQQVVDGIGRREFRPHNVVHMPFHRKKGNVLGTPYVLPVLDDVEGLRRIEELCEILVHKHAYPFFHVQVGTEKQPAQVYDNNHSEVDDIASTVKKMPFEGTLVTSHRCEVTAVSAKNAAIDAKPYLEYYEARVLSGLNLSGPDIGRGGTANRATAQTMSRALCDRCTRFQSFYATHFTFYILDELVRELGIAPPPENRVYLIFNTIDTEEARARDNHASAQYQSGLITETDALIAINRDPITPEQRKDMHFEHIGKPMALIKSMDELSGLGKPSATENREQPENQQGKKASKPNVAVNSAWQRFAGSCVRCIDLDQAYQPLLNEISTMSERWLAEGLKLYTALPNTGDRLYIGTNMSRAFNRDVLKPRLQSFMRLVSRAIGAAHSTSEAVGTMEILRPLFDEIMYSLQRVGQDYGFASVAQVEKHKTIRWTLTDVACKQCRERGPIQICRFGPYDLERHEACTSGVEVCE